MQTRQPCRHCGGLEFFSFTVQAGGSTGSLLPVGALHGPSYDNIVCGQCGHTEWFVSKDDLVLVKEKFRRLADAS